MSRIGLILGLFFCAESLAYALEELHFADKFGVRICNGYMTNLGTAGGSALNLGALNFQYQHFYTPQFSLGLGYRLDFDFALGNTPFHGFDANARWYLKGSGTRFKEPSSEITSLSRDSRAFYLLGEVAQRSYYLGSNMAARPNQEQSGSFIELSVGGGGDFRLTRDWEFNVEGAYGFWALAASDDRVRVTSMLLKVGLVYLW